jgi:hypothetical protein
MLTMVLEYIPTDLKKHMDMLSEEDERLPQLTVKRYMFQLLKGLYFLHRTGVMHRSVCLALPCRRRPLSCHVLSPYRTHAHTRAHASLGRRAALAVLHRLPAM